MVNVEQCFNAVLSNAFENAFHEEQAQFARNGKKEPEYLDLDLRVSVCKLDNGQWPL